MSQLRSTEPLVEFEQAVQPYFGQKHRKFPWRETSDPYHILVSEMMLQQTQAARVVPYFENFLTAYPTIASLALAKIPELLQLWQGLGYNRRALYLQKTAQQIVTKNNGQVPNSLDELTALPGIGHNSAGAILAYAFNKRVIFIETNIRKAIIHHFFKQQVSVSDQEIGAILEKIVPADQPRQWYWAVVDYGNFLGLTKTVTNDRSKHNVKQSKFVGSKRFTRSQLLQALLRQPQSRSELLLQFESLPFTSEALTELLAEGFCVERNGQVVISD